MSKPPRAKTKPCSICRHWFTPSPRLGERQRTCGPACSHKHERRRQAQWRRSNPGYAAQRRADADVARIEQAGAGQQASAMAKVLGPAPAFYRQVPWEVAKTVMGPQGLVLLAKFGRLAQRHAKTVMQLQVIEIKGELAGLRRDVAKTAIAGGMRPRQAPE